MKKEQIKIEAVGDGEEWQIRLVDGAKSIIVADELEEISAFYLAQKLGTLLPEWEVSL